MGRVQRILVASFLEEEHVATIRSLGAPVDYEPELLPVPRYAADHFGAPLQRTPEEEKRWRGLLARADVLFDFDYSNAEALPDLAPGLVWIQATSAGIGQFVKRHRYAERMPRTLFTTARGVHARPLAEFCALGMLAHSRGLFRILEGQRERRWERFAGTDLLGKTVVIFGYGLVGQEVARLARALGLTVVGVNRSADSGGAPGAGADELYSQTDLRRVLPRADYLVLAAPHTGETEGAIGRSELGSLKRGAVLINVGRGALLDEEALVEGLLSGHLGGAVLDVFAHEPLRGESPLWTLPNVIVSPHSASTSDRENSLLTDLFCRNFRRLEAGEPLENLLHPARLY
jgi:phosphoglycerate dehydrogenase-like enzyme